jgi:hypothetical protein
MSLGEEHFATGTLRRTPSLDVPLQRSELAVGELARVLALQRLENRLCFQTRVPSHLFLNLFPHPLERILARAPRSFGLALARQFPCPQVLPGSLDIHAGLGGRQLLRLFCFRQPLQPPDLGIGYHLRRAPRGRELRWSLMVVVDREF